MVACHRCPCAQIQCTRTIARSLMRQGERPAFLSISHSAYNSGYASGNGFLCRPPINPLQWGQPSPSTRSRIAAFHVCPCPHFHQTMTILRLRSFSGRSGKFFSVSHCSSSSGCMLARSLTPGSSRIPAQVGQRPAFRIVVFGLLPH